MDIFDNWLFQAIFANIFWCVIVFISKSFIKWLNEKPKEISNEPNTPHYSKKTLRLQFYICLFIGVLSFHSLFSEDESSRVISFVTFGWCFLLAISSFECALDSFKDINDKK